MRGHTVKNVVAENIRATNAAHAANRTMNGKKKMCWRCQKDKTPVGGHLKMFPGGPMKFICKDCLDVKKEKENETTHPT